MHRARSSVLSALAVALLAASCGKSTSSPPTNGAAPSTPPAKLRLFTDDEIAIARADLAAELDANAKRTCTRPVLTGSPTPGPATADILAITEPTDAAAAATSLTRCLTRLEALANTTDLHGDAGAHAPAVVQFDQACGAQLEAAIRVAIAHENACSPYQVGQRAWPANFVALVHLALVMSMRAELRAGAGDVAGAIDLELAVIRFAQDLGRGHFNLLGQMVGTGATDIAIEHLRGILAKAHPAASLLDRLAAELDALMASEVPLSDALAGELEQTALYFGEASLQPDGWVPPGGWPKDTKRPVMNDKLDAHDWGAVWLATASQLATQYTVACPSGATMLACHDGLEQLGSAHAETQTDPVAAITELAIAGAGHVDPKALAAQVVAKLVSLSTARYGSYQAKRARIYAELAALRLQIEIARTIATTHACPTAAELAVAPFATLAAPAHLGAPLAVAVQPHGHTIDMTLPTFVANSSDEPWHVACP